MKKLLIILSLALTIPLQTHAGFFDWIKHLFGNTPTTLGAAFQTFQRSLVPIDSTENIGTTTSPWDNGFFNTLCLTADSCISVWPTGGGGGGGDSVWTRNNTKGLVYLPTTTDFALIGRVSTTTTAKLEINGGIYANASSTINAGLTVLTGTTTHATSTNFFSTTASSTSLYFTSANGGSLTAHNLISDLLSARTSAGTIIEAANGTDVGIFGAGNSANTTLYGGVNIDGTTRLATSLTGLLKATSGTVSTASAGTDYESGLTAGDGLTRTANDFDCDTASGSTFGCLSSADWTTFNNKGSGTVTAVSVTSANGFAGSSSGGATPALTLSTTITGVLKGNGTAISAASNGTDYTLISATTCGGTDKVSAISADGTVTCSADSGGSGGGGGDSVWSRNTTTNLIYHPTTTDSVMIGGSSTTTTAKLNITGGLFASATSTINYLTSILSTTTHATTTNLNVSGTLTVPNLTSALVLSGSTGALEEYAGTGCTNQVIEDMIPSGAANCVSINNAYWSGTDLSVANGGTGLSTFGGTNTVLYTTSADNLSSESAFTYNPTSNELGSDNAVFTRSTSTNATSTNLTVSSTLRLSGLNCSGNTNGGALTTDANGFVSCSDDDGGAGGSIDGGGLAGMMTSWTDSNTIQATSTIVGATFHGTSTTATSTFANAVHIDNYLSVGPDLYSGTYPELVDTFSPTNYIADFSRDLDDYGIVTVTNKNAGTNASAGYLLNNNLSGYYPDSDSFEYYAELTLNSSNFNNPIYGATNVPNAVTLNNKAGPVLISSSTSTPAGYVSIIAGGVASEDLRVTAGGNVGIGTSSPAANLSIAGRATQGTQPLFLISSSTAQFATTTRFIIDNQGQVGINTSAALAAGLTVAPRQGASAGAAVFRTMNIGGTSVLLTVDTNGSMTAPNIILNPAQFTSGLQVNMTAGGIGINTTVPAAATIDSFRISKTGRGQQFLVDRFGQVAIATATPQAMLTVVSSSTASTTLSLHAFSNQTADILQAWRATNTKAFAITGNGYVTAGTSTPHGFSAMSIATSTGQQLVLLDGSLTSPGWAFRNAGGNLYIGTTSPSTFATSTSNSALSFINGTSTRFNFGTTTAKTRQIFGIGNNPLTTNSSTTVSVGKLQFEGYNSAGTLSCTFVVGTSWVVIAGACND